jgi:serine protease inhibitor
MWFILPDEGVTPEELLSDGKVTEFILADGDWAENKFLVVNLALPKFDVVSDTDLIPDLKALGVSDVFNIGASDFPPMTADTDEIFLSQAEHAARVAIDEEGVVAAAYTVMISAGAAMPPDEEIDFVVDRPFIFAITGADGLPLFVGIVNRPA